MDFIQKDLIAPALSCADSWLWDIERNVVRVAGPLSAQLGIHSMGDIDAARIGDLLGHDRLRDLRDNLISLLKGERRLIQTVTTFAESPSIGPVIIQARVLERNEENKALKIIGLAAALSHLSEAISGTEGGDKWRHYFQEALRQSEERVRSFIDSVDDMVYFQGIDGSLSLLNKANEHITGYTLEEFRQNPQLWREIVRSEDVEIAERFFEEHPEGVPYFEVEYRLKSKSGQWKWILSRMFASRDKSGAIIGYHCLDRDVTELKRTEELVVQTERLKAVAELATGVAHNFNNLLQILMSAAQMSFINLELDSREELKKNLNQILQSSKLGVNTVKRLQEFARLRTDLQSQETRICDLSALTEQAIEMTKSWRKKRPQQEGYSIRLESDLQRGCYIKCVESEIFEALINLIKNSAEAIHEDGLIKITTLGNDSEVQLTISDTGEGLAEEELNRIFDPFWTKKGIKGTGMGLTVSKGTIVRHGGVIEVFSSGPGNGATFKITLPPASPEVETNKAADEIGGFLSLRILLIDDIEAVLTMLKENLEKFGQKILAARSGAEGLNAIESETIDIVICDYAMPDMDGVEVAEAVRDHFISIGKQRPPFILITGWGGELPSDEELREIGVDALLEKPIDMEKLMEMAIKVVREKNKSSQIP